MCDLTAGFNDRICTNGKGGIKSATFIELANIATLTVVSNEVTVLDLEVGKTAFQYKLRSNLSSYNANPRRNDENGTTWFEQLLTMVLNQDTKELRAEIYLLLQSEVAVLVEKADGTYVLLGAGEGLKINDGSESGSGTAKEDRNGHSLTFAGLENEPVPDVDPTVAAAIIATTP